MPMNIIIARAINSLSVNNCFVVVFLVVLRVIVGTILFKMYQ